MVMEPEITTDGMPVKISPMSKAHQVFKTTELLEEILFNVSFYKLFVLQGTCKAFRNTIQKSPRLQRKMFLRPLENSPLHQPISQLNPFLLSTVFRPKLAIEWGSRDGITYNSLNLENKRVVCSVQSSNYQARTLALNFSRRQCRLKCGSRVSGKVTRFFDSDAVKIRENATSQLFLTRKLQHKEGQCLGAGCEDFKVHFLDEIDQGSWRKMLMENLPTNLNTIGLYLPNHRTGNFPPDTSAMRAHGAFIPGVLSFFKQKHEVHTTGDFVDGVMEMYKDWKISQRDAESLRIAALRVLREARAKVGLAMSRESNDFRPSPRRGRGSDTGGRML